jgi:hypothetical protein
MLARCGAKALDEEMLSSLLKSQRPARGRELADSIVRSPFLVFPSAIKLLKKFMRPNIEIQILGGKAGK